MVEREREEERARESERELERERERERGRYCLEAEVKQNRRHSETKAGLTAYYIWLDPTARGGTLMGIITAWTQH